MITGRDPAKGRHRLAVQVPGSLVDGIVVMVVQNGGRQRKGPVFELLGDPVVGFCILSLETHGFRHRLVGKGHGQRDHRAVI